MKYAGINSTFRATLCIFFYLEIIVANLFLCFIGLKKKQENLI